VRRTIFDGNSCELYDQGKVDSHNLTQPPL
jgi:hypothetical protein